VLRLGGESGTVRHARPTKNPLRTQEGVKLQETFGAGDQGTGCLGAPHRFAQATLKYFDELEFGAHGDLGQRLDRD